MIRRTTRAVFAGALPLALLLATVRAAGQGPHGAATMADQLAALARLGLPADGLTPPPGVDPVIWSALTPPDNAPTRERVELGRKLYFEMQLSRDGTVSCATCHDVTRGFTDRRPVSEGVGGQLGRRNAPTTLNAALIEPQFLDGRSGNVEAQAKMPILNPVEMDMDGPDAVVAKLRAIPGYSEAFQKAYGRDVNYDDVGRAIGAFERTLVFVDAPLDRWLRGDEAAVSEAAKRGWALYNGKARCASCHPINASSLTGTDQRFHNVGVSARKQDFEKLARQALQALAKTDSERELDRLAVGTDLSELGRFMITKNPGDIGAFRTLQVRNAGITAPYMHDGSLQTLWDVMDHYNKGGEENPFLDGGIEPLDLSEAEIDDVVEMMFALTDVRFAADNQRELQRQREHAAKSRPFRDADLASRRRIQFADRVMKSGDARGINKGSQR